MSASSTAVSPRTSDILVRVLIALGVAFILYKIIGRLFNAIASPFGYGLTSAEQAIVDARFKPGPLNVALYDRVDPEGLFITDRPDNAAGIIHDEVPYLEDIARAIADAPGFFADNEAGLFDAVRRIRSKYELLWVNRLFNGAPWRSLGVFDVDGPAPSIGSYLDAFLQPRDWLKVAEHLNNLPKYP